MGRAADFRKMGSIVDKEVSLHGERMKENPDVPAQELVPQFEDYICDTTPNGKKKSVLGKPPAGHTQKRLQYTVTYLGILRYTTY